MKQTYDDGGHEYVRVLENRMKDGRQLRVWCPVEGPALGEMMAQVYALVADSIIHNAEQHE